MTGKVAGLTEETVLVLKAAAKPSGYQPNIGSTADLCSRLTSLGLLKRSINGAPVWFITYDGRRSLEEFEANLRKRK